MKAVILAGGLSTRIPEETHAKPKPMNSKAISSLDNKVFKNWISLQPELTSLEGALQEVATMLELQTLQVGRN